MWPVLRSTLIVTLLGGWTLLAAAADSPAQLPVGEDSIEELMRLPQGLTPGRYTIHCLSHVLRSGSIPRVFCYTSEQEQASTDLINAVVTAAKRSRFIPATREGDAVEVYVQLMVLIDTTLGEPMILAVPNGGTERASFGLLYTAPQRLIRNPSGYWHHQNGNWFGAEAEMLVWRQALVDEHGNVREFKLNNVIGDSRAATLFYEKDSRRMKFLPGYVRGRPAPMLYVEPIFSLR
jgi:hypothetical protein